MTHGYNKTFNSTGPKWYSLQFDGDASANKLSLSTNTSADIYVSKGKNSDPNNLIYDVSILNVKSVQLASFDTLRFVGTDGYSVAIYLPAIDESTNTLLPSSLTVAFIERATVLQSMALLSAVMLAFSYFI